MNTTTQHFRPTRAPRYGSPAVVVAFTVAVLAIIAVLAGCGGRTTYVAAPAGYNDGYDISAPPVYGQNGHCYYRSDPAEVAALQAAGMCSRSWSAYPMPSAWLTRYASYYDSPSYYQSFPSTLRTRYVTTVRTYEKTHPQVARNVARAQQAQQGRSTTKFNAGGRQGGDTASSRTTSSRSSGGTTSTSRRGSSTSFKSGGRK